MKGYPFTPISVTLPKPFSNLPSAFFSPKDVLKKLDAENALPDERLLLDERMMSEKIIKSNKRNIKNHIRLTSQKKKINPSQNKRKI